jgi:hypothetical protein
VAVLVARTVTVEQQLEELPVSSSSSRHYVEESERTAWAEASLATGTRNGEQLT